MEHCPDVGQNLCYLFPRAWVQGALALEVLLGLTWTLGYLLVSDESLPLAYIFAILNSLQGLFIFVFHCLLNKKVRLDSHHNFHCCCRYMCVFEFSKGNHIKRCFFLFCCCYYYCCCCCCCCCYIFVEQQGGCP